MRRHLFRKVIVVLGVSAMALGVVGILPAAARTNEDSAQSEIIFQGSDTTYLVMQALGDHYNAALGCKVEFTAPQVQPRNTQCLDTDPNTANRQVVYDSGVTDANPDHDIVINEYPIGSGNGILRLEQKAGEYLEPSACPPVGSEACPSPSGGKRVRRSDVARSSRAPRTTDLEGEQFTAFAKEGQSWISYNNTTAATEPRDGVTNLATQTVKDIWKGTTPGNPATCATNWTNASIGGANSGPVVVWVAQAGSGTRAAWDTFVTATGTQSDTCVPAALKDGNPANGERLIFENQSGDIFTSTANDCPEVDGTTFPGGTDAGYCTPYSIFHYSTARFTAVPPTTANTAGVLGNVQTVAPTFANIQNGTFPFIRNVYNVTRDGCADDLTEPNCQITNQFAFNYVRSFVDPDVDNDNVGAEGGGDQGWLCATDLPINAKTGQSYRTEIENIVIAYGFVPLSNGATGGGVSGNSYCRVENTETKDT